MRKYKFNRIMHWNIQAYDNEKTVILAVDSNDNVGPTLDLHNTVAMVQFLPYC